MTVGKNTAVEDLNVPWDVSATVIWKSGTTFLPSLTVTEKANIDTGMGLERLAVVSQNVDSIFDVDTICAIRDKVCEAAHINYHEDEKKDISVRLITDHIRSATFMISDGINASNEGRGYVLRRLIRRAARHIRMLQIPDHFMPVLAETVIECSKDAYPELEDKKAMILNTLTNEEEKFYKTLDQGMKILNEMLDADKAQGSTVLSGADAFRLYDTYGFPLDLTRDVLEEHGMTIDEDGFAQEMQNLDKSYKKGSLTINVFADRIISSKERLIHVIHQEPQG